MTTARAGQLRIGDFVRFDGQLREIVGIDGSAVILLADSGRRVVIKSNALLSDSTFEIINSHRRRRPLPPAYFALLPAEFREKALWLESHVSEILDGVAVGSEPGTAPRPAYDVTRTTLRQQELAKCRELADAGHKMGIRTLQRYRRGYAAQGIEGLIDKRAVRPSALTGRVDERYVDTLRKVVEKNVNWVVLNHRPEGARDPYLKALKAAPLGSTAEVGLLDSPSTGAEDAITELSPCLTDRRDGLRSSELRASQKPCRERDPAIPDETRGCGPP